MGCIKQRSKFLPGPFACTASPISQAFTVLTQLKKCLTLPINDVPWPRLKTTVAEMTVCGLFSRQSETAEHVLICMKRALYLNQYVKPSILFFMFFVLMLIELSAVEIIPL